MKRTLGWTVSVAILGALALNSAAAQVVADSACPKHAVDIAYFATCEGDRVAKDETRELRPGTDVENQVRAVSIVAPAVSTASPKPNKRPANQPRKKKHS